MNGELALRIYAATYAATVGATLVVARQEDMPAALRMSRRRAGDHEGRPYRRHGYRLAIYFYHG